MEFATFDLAAFEAAKEEDRNALARQLDQVCREIGFLVLTGHGVPQDVIDGVWDRTGAFFDQSAGQKSSVRAPEPGYPYGYLGPNSEALAKSKGHETPPDLKESFNGGPLVVPDGMTDSDALAFCYAPTIWPDVAGFQSAWTRYYKKMEDLAARIMIAFAAALDLPDDYFQSYIDQPISALRALNYPATGAVALENQQRAGAHTDYGSLTILLPQAGSKGLQVQSPQGEWVDVPAPDGVFVINIGDLMARWTADRWVSTLHRVVVRPHQPARKSLAFFHQPNWHAEIRPLDGSAAYDMVRSGPYLMDKFRSTGA